MVDRKLNKLRYISLVGTFVTIVILFNCIGSHSNGMHLRKLQDNGPSTDEVSLWFQNLKVWFSNFIDSFKYEPFEIIASEVVPEVNSNCVTYRHKKTGAEILFVDEFHEGEKDDKKDENNVDESAFGIFFRTPPSDSTGVPHIFEHAVLAGSRKYTTKEPFANLLKSSLQTFLNAMTFSDRTGYVFASVNTKDFYNIMNVYLDAVFFPKATSDRFIFAQEGWRLQPVSNTITNETKLKNIEMEYAGVVYSEMQGAYSDAYNLLHTYTQMSLFPDNAYFYDSGGDPEIIPDLTFEQFADFHSKFYHPSNSKIFVSGAQDKASVMSIVDEYLSEFDMNMNIKEASKVSWQMKNFDEPKKISYPYPTTHVEEGHIVTVSWLLNDAPMTQLEEIALVFLNSLLSVDTSLFYKNLTESQFGSFPIMYLETDMLQQYYIIGLHGVNESDVEDVVPLIIRNLEHLAEEGFTDSEMSAIMSTTEFYLREYAQESSKGISMMFSSMSKWMYDYSSTDGLKYEQALLELKKTIDESGSTVFQDIIKKMFLDNAHRVELDLYPSDSLKDERKKSEKNKIEAMMEGFTDEEIEDILRFDADLKEWQMTPDTEEAVATIPTLTIEDLNPVTKEYPIDVVEDAYGSGVTMIKNEVFSSSGIIYANFAVDVSTVPFSDLHYLSLFESLLTQTGADNYTYEEITEQTMLETGGVGSALFIESVAKSVDNSTIIGNDKNFVTKLIISGKSLTEKANVLLEIIEMILTKATLDSQDKALEILKAKCSAAAMMVSSGGSLYASLELGARYSVMGVINEEMHGISSIDSCNELLKEVEDDWPSVLEKLNSIRNAILAESTCRSGMVINLTGDKKALDNVNADVEKFLNRLPGNSKEALPNYHTTDHPWVEEAMTKMKDDFPKVDQALITSSSVNYVGQGGNIYQKGEILDGSVNVVTEYLTMHYLWQEVRVVLGAYGASNQLSQGFHSFISWKDPNIVETLKVYDQTPDFLDEATEELKQNPKKLELAIISTIGGLDGAPLSSESQGLVSFSRWLRGESAATRKKMRDEIINAKPEAFQDFSERLKNSERASVYVVCSMSAYEEALDHQDEVGRNISMVLLK